MCTKATVYMNEQEPRFHATLDNSKLGGLECKIMAVGYVPGAGIDHFSDGRMITDCTGTCGAVDCSGCGLHGVCYAIDSHTRYTHKTINNVENTMQLRSDMGAHFNDIYKAAVDNNVDTIRYTESGEIENYEQFEHVITLAGRVPDKELYLYTKNYDVLDTFFGAGYELPENVTVLISIWENTGVDAYERYKHHAGIKAFVVDNDSVKADAQCPAYILDESGTVVMNKAPAARCGNCKLCTRARAAKVIRCLNHSKKNMTRRAR